MFCTKCGLHIEDDSKFCTGCGTPTDVDCQPTETTVVPQSAKIKDEFDDFNAYHQQPVCAVRTGPSMSWNNFLTSFLLYAGAVSNLILAILVMTGMYFQFMADLAGAPSGGFADALREIYLEYSGLKSLNIMTGILLIILAVYAVFARMRLVAFKKDAVFHVPVFYLLSAILCIVFLQSSAVLWEWNRTSSLLALCCLFPDFCTCCLIPFIITREEIYSISNFK